MIHPKVYHLGTKGSRDIPKVRQNKGELRGRAIIYTCITKKIHIISLQTPLLKKANSHKSVRVSHSWPSHMSKCTSDRKFKPLAGHGVTSNCTFFNQSSCSSMMHLHLARSNQLHSCLNLKISVHRSSQSRNPWNA